MNFLGHAYFSPDNDDILAGNVFGDFVKGRVDNSSFPENIKTGLKLHRKIDVQCNEIEEYHLIKNAVGKDYGHYRGVIADIFLDHFLSVYWKDFSDIKLEAFAEDAYKKIEKANRYFPDGFDRVFGYIKRDNYFLMNRNPENIRTILKRVEQYSAGAMPLYSSVDLLESNQKFYKEHFYKFMAEMHKVLSSEY
jgi:acyl carrier protein phosphodiesterase